MRMHRLVVIMAAFLTALCAAVLLAFAVALPAAAEVSAPRAKILEHMVIQDCGSCHGMTLKGGLGKPLTVMALEGSPPEVLAAIILDGVPGTAMPSWRPLLTEEEADWIAHYLLKDVK